MKIWAALSLLLIFSAFIGCESFADEKEATVATGQKTSRLKKTKKKIRVNESERLGIDQSDFMPAENQFGLIASYSFRYDSLQKESSKSLLHNLGMALTYTYGKHLSGYASFGFQHESNGSNIIRNNDSDTWHQLSNITLGAVYVLDPFHKSLARNTMTFAVSLPVSERSQVDQHIGNLMLSNYLQSKNWKRFSIYNRFTANYLANSLRFSIWNDDGFSGDRINRDWLVRNSIGLNFQVLNRIGIRSGLTTNYLTYLDGSSDLSFGNQTSIFANYFGFQFFAQLVNFSYPENDRLQVGYYDKYRRLFSMGVTHAF